MPPPNLLFSIAGRSLSWLTVSSFCCAISLESEIIERTGVKLCVLALDRFRLDRMTGDVFWVLLEITMLFWPSWRETPVIEVCSILEYGDGIKFAYRLAAVLNRARFLFFIGGMTYNFSWLFDAPITFRPCRSSDLISGNLCLYVLSQLI